jgi:hypothetical protein
MRNMNMRFKTFYGTNSWQSGVNNWVLHFHPSLIYVIKIGAYLSGVMEIHCSLARTAAKNTLAYYSTVKSVL